MAPLYIVPRTLKSTTSSQCQIRTMYTFHTNCILGLGLPCANLRVAGLTVCLLLTVCLARRLRLHRACPACRASSSGLEGDWTRQGRRKQDPRAEAGACRYPHLAASFFLPTGADLPCLPTYLVIQYLHTCTYSTKSPIVGLPRLSCDPSASWAGPHCHGHCALSPATLFIVFIVAAVVPSSSSSSSSSFTSFPLPPTQTRQPPCLFPSPRPRQIHLLVHDQPSSLSC